MRAREPTPVHERREDAEKRAPQRRAPAAALLEVHPWRARSGGTVSTPEPVSSSPEGSEAVGNDAKLIIVVVAVVSGIFAAA